MNGCRAFPGSPGVNIRPGKEREYKLVSTDVSTGVVQEEIPATKARGREARDARLEARDARLEMRDARLEARNELEQGVLGTVYRLDGRGGQLPFVRSGRFETNVLPPEAQALLTLLEEKGET